MTLTVNYTRGIGNYNFTTAEIAQLTVIFDKLAEDIANKPTQIGLGGAAYSAVLNMISDDVLVPHNVDTQVIWEHELRPKAGVNVSVWTWISGAQKVNAANGFFANFIREYTVAQVNLRGLPTTDTPQKRIGNSTT